MRACGKKETGQLISQRCIRSHTWTCSVNYRQLRTNVSEWGNAASKSSREKDGWQATYVDRFIAHVALLVRVSGFSLRS